MKNVLVIVCLFFSGLLISCDDQKKKSNDTPVEGPTTEMPAPVEPTLETTPPQITGQENISPSPAVTPATEGNVTAEGLNPAHGQPGHRCELAVGAPLNSTPTKPGEVTPQPSEPIMFNAPQPNAAPSTPVNVPTPPGMNPPHGQPGHDCGVAVGAPLKK